MHQIKGELQIASRSLELGKNVVIKTRIIVRYRIWFVIMSDNKKTEKKPCGAAVHEKEQTIRIRVVVVLYFHQFWDISKHKQTERKEKIGGY